MDFEKRLEKAIHRGEKTRDKTAQEQAARQLSQEELKALHSQYRLSLSEHIEICLRKLAEHFPGFEFSTVVGDDGWGAKVSRDDLQFADGKKKSVFSRLQLAIRPFGTQKIVELVTKATVANRDLVNQSQFQFLADFDEDTYRAMIDQRVLDFAEAYAARD